jgi:hypothetical protein
MVRLDQASHRLVEPQNLAIEIEKPQALAIAPKGEPCWTKKNALNAI